MNTTIPMTGAFNTQATPTITSLADKAILTRLRISKWQPYAFDKEATLTVELANGVTKAERFNKKLMAECSMLTEVGAAYNAVYLYHCRTTVPWLDDGVRMLPSGLYLEYTQEIRKLIDEADRAADKLADNWSTLVGYDMYRLGPMANILDYPTDIRSCFGADVSFRPVPQEGDFRVAISDEDRASLASAITEAENSVTTYLLQEMAEPIRRLAERCEAFQGTKGERWHHSLVSNVEELVYRLPRLNINQDPRIDALIKDIKETVKPYAYSPDALKEDPIARIEVKGKLDDLMARMGGFMGAAR